MTMSGADMAANLLCARESVLEVSLDSLGDPGSGAPAIMTPSLMRRARPWILALAVLLGVGAGLLAAVPSIARWAAIKGLRSATGREVVIRELRLNLFTRRLAVTGLRIDDTEAGRPLAELERFEVRFRLLPLLRGRLQIDTATLTRPRISVARLASGRLSIADVIQRFTAGPPSKEPADVTIGGFAIEDGAVTFEDRAITPARTWTRDGLALEIRDVRTRSDVPRGTVAVRFVLAGAPVTIDVDAIRVRPARARARFTVTGLDLSGVWPYVPADAPIRPDRGRFSTRGEIQYSAEAGLRVGGDVTLADIALFRSGQAEAFVTTPLLSMTSRDVVYRDGSVTAARLELAGDPSIVDASVSPARQFDLSGVRLVLEDVSYPTQSPARVSLVAGLPAGGAMDVRGTLSVHPLAAALQVALTDIDLALASPYVPAVSPVTVGSGRLATKLTVAYAQDGDLRVDGDVSAASLVLLRRGQTEPFVTHPLLSMGITDLRVKGKAVALGRLTVAGAPTIVDATVSPPARFAFTSLALTAEDVTWPSRAPARVALTAALDAAATSPAGGTPAGKSTLGLTGTFDPGTMATDVRATLTSVALARAAVYLPRDSAVTLGGGALGAAVAMRFDRATGVRLRGDGAVTDLALVRRGEREPFVTDPRLAFTIDDLGLRDGALTVKRVQVSGAPRLNDASTSPARRLELRGLRIEAANAAWPAPATVPLRIDADLPGAGTLGVRGTVALATRAVDLAIDVKDADVAAYHAWIPIEAPVAGRLSAELAVTGGFADRLDVSAKGSVAARALTLGPPGNPPLSLDRLSLTGLDVRWPSRLAVERVSLVKPWVLVERGADGSLPLRETLMPRRRDEVRTTAAASPPSPEPRAPPPAAAPSAPMAIEIGEIVVEDGDARVVDRSTTPFFSEELSRLSLAIRGVRNAPDAVADISVRGVVDTDGALELSGQIAPLADPFRMDLAGELTQVSLLPANPYLRLYSGWLARTGSITTKLTYHVVGHRLEASNDVHVQRLKVERAPDDVAGGSKRVTLPLGLIVAMITDGQGDIRFKLPVEGDLNAPGFSFGDAIWAAIRNVLVNVAAAPFRAIGKLFSRGEQEPEQFHVEPITFEPGAATLGADAQRQLQRVADFLRASPAVKLAMAPVVTESDVARLRRDAVLNRIEGVQQARQIPTFAAAASAIFKEAYPDRAVPESPDDAVAALAEREPVPDEAVKRLASSRVEAARQTLVDSAGIERQRLAEHDATASVNGSGDGRVEFELRP
jgi:uncharacterized protein DUF748